MICFYQIYLKEVNILWAGHQVHHSSEDYNLSTALSLCYRDILLGYELKY